MKTNIRALLALGTAGVVGMCIYATTFTTTDLVMGNFTIAAAAMDLITKLIVCAIPGYLVWYLTKGSRRFSRRR